MSQSSPNASPLLVRKFPAEMQDSFLQLAPPTSMPRHAVYSVTGRDDNTPQPDCGGRRPAGDADNSQCSASRFQDRLRTLSPGKRKASSMPDYTPPSVSRDRSTLGSQQPSTTPAHVRVELIDVDDRAKIVIVFASVERTSCGNAFVLRRGAHVLASFDLNSIKLSRFWGPRSSIDRIVELVVVDPADTEHCDCSIHFKVETLSCLETLSHLTGFDLT